ncbi:hypothetical protein RFM41_33485 [Mesorhizobium sp. VK25A]|uniref:Uncharacterized protein n=1 Tax=Mesorhizobium vachelliae TaxID=3072309 RepID=A0ABU5AF50_9HYPH|nr:MULTISPECIES: hypothetical protein [unclassified Mesorhizobium]MDX8535895.1 hypothetical protein [Mesorhizobium sp. VK25D]MDX8548649.1 hypothetical protein [Mesorhizobium sp. VK25A]
MCAIIDPAKPNDRLLLGMKGVALRLNVTLRRLLAMIDEPFTVEGIFPKTLERRERAYKRRCCFSYVLLP